MSASEHDKAARLAAIRAQNAAKKAQAAEPTEPAPQDKAARLAAIRAQNAAKKSEPVANPVVAAPALVKQAAPVAAPSADELLEAASASLMSLMLALVIGIVAAVLVLPRWIPGLSSSLLGEQPKAFWYLSRSSGLVAYSLVWLSMLFGLSLTGKVARLWNGGPTMLDLHQHASILGIGFGLFHTVILLGDGYSNYTLKQLLVPFASSQYKPLWVGLGQVGLYGLAIVTMSFWLKRWIGRSAWRIIHYASFGLFLLVLAHGIFSGSDTSMPLVTLWYWATGASVVFMTLYRVLIMRRSKPLPSVAATPRA
ncbi:ferric reductase-like transmembrane domain-containing protein [Herpetosiphon llansteffanensis]|uniref:ferric reductase-like transmembrane domain-containing protein n=1 Tax=Herpetosiphon llansteffanensis TaxID=2094568 RepID=UPI000D7BCBB9|nr:ferric reductase-like transmembrane domain-containing protein [Herpetosiphon llansteffanensis]